MSTKLLISKLYIAMLGRAPDAGGLVYWTKQVDEGRMSLSDVAFNWVEHQPEFRDLYPSTVNTAEFVRLIYDNILDRAPDPSGNNYWKEQLEKGALSRDSFVLDILYSLSQTPTGSDARLLENRAQVGVALAEADIQDKNFYGISIRAVTDNANTLKLVENLIQLAKAQPSTQASLHQVLEEVRSMNLAGNAANDFAKLVAKVAPELEKGKSSAELSVRVEALLEVARAANKDKGFLTDADALGDYLLKDAAKVYEAAHQLVQGFDKPISLEAALLVGKINAKYSLTKDVLTLEGLSVAEATAKLQQVEALIKGAENSSGLSVKNLYTWTVEDTAAKLLATLGTTVPQAVSDAKSVGVTDSAITLEQLGKLQAYGNFEVGKVQVDIALPLQFDSWIKGPNTISFTLEIPSFLEFEGLSLTGSGSMVSNITSVAAGSSTRINVQIEVSNNATSGSMQLKLNSKAFDPAKFEVAFKNVKVNGKDFGPYTYTETDGSAQKLQAEVPMLLHLETVLNSDTKDILYELRPTPLNETETTVAAIAKVLPKVEQAIKNAANGNKIVLTDIYRWEIKDTADNILKEMEKPSHGALLSGAKKITLSEDEVTAQDLKALETLKNFELGKDIKKIATPLTLEEAYELDKKGTLAEPYELKENIFDLAESLAQVEKAVTAIEKVVVKAKNADRFKQEDDATKVDLSKLLKVTVKDTGKNLLDALKKEVQLKLLESADAVEVSGNISYLDWVKLDDKSFKELIAPNVSIKVDQNLDFLPVDGSNKIEFRIKLPLGFDLNSIKVGAREIAAKESEEEDNGKLVSFSVEGLSKNAVATLNFRWDGKADLDGHASIQDVKINGYAFDVSKLGSLWIRSYLPEPELSGSALQGAMQESAATDFAMLAFDASDDVYGDFDDASGIDIEFEPSFYSVSNLDFEAY